MLSDERFSALCEHVQETMERLGVPGVAVGVLLGGEERAAGFGVTSVAHPLPVTPDTLFQIGSITKTFIGTAAMLLVGRGALDLDAPVRGYLPELRLADAAAEARVTMRHLLTHTAGWPGDFFIDTGPGDDALVRYVARMAELPQLTPPGAIFSYNNAGFCLAGRVIEALTGQPIEAAIRELVLDPLGLDHAFFFPAEVMTHRFAVGHAVGEAGAEVLRPWPLLRASNAAGGISTSVPQLLRYARAHLGERPDALSPDVAAGMRVAQAPAGNFADEVGLTWMLRRVGGVALAQHGGATYGQMAQLVIAPERSFALALLTNANRGGVLNAEIVTWALERFLGAADPEPAPLQLDEGALRGYAGRYAAMLDTAELRVEGGELIMQVVPSGGFPTPDTPPPPPPPPVRLAFTAEDRVVALDEPLKGQRSEFVRGPDGAIVWLRTGGRLHRRLAEA